jgi:hypothetical protein
VSNRFAASLSLDLGGSGLGTELFLESVPDDFLGELPPEWHWEKGDTLLPILISRDFLALYNLGFASSRGLPPVSEGMLGMVTAHAEAWGPGGRFESDARIVGLTDRLASILVPESFMRWANAAIALEEAGAARRLVVETEPSHASALDALLQKRGWERMKEGGAAAGILGIGRIALTLSAAAGAVLALLAAVLIGFSMSLTVERARGPIGALRLMGYSRARLGVFIGISGGIGILAAAAAAAACAWPAVAGIRGFISLTLGSEGLRKAPTAAFLAAGGLALLFAVLLPIAGFAQISALEKRNT